MFGSLFRQQEIYSESNHTDITFITQIPAQAGIRFRLIEERNLDSHLREDDENWMKPTFQFN